MSFPLFDSGYTLWAADLECRLMEQHGLSARAMGLEPRMLMERYYRGESVFGALSGIAERSGISRRAA